MAQQPLHAEAQLLLLDLFRIGGTHRGDAPGVLQSRLEEGHVAVVLHAVGLQARGRQTQATDRRGREDALIGEIVDGHYGARFLARYELQVGRGQSRLPIVAMHDLGPP